VRQVPATRTVSIPPRLDIAGTGEAMKLYLKSKGEDRYWVRPGVWTESQIEASDFASFRSLLECRFEQEIQNVEALFWFEDPHCNFTLSVD